LVNLKKAEGKPEKPYFIGITVILHNSNLKDKTKDLRNEVEDGRKS